MKIELESIKKKIIDNSLWLAGLGLFIASSGIDGAYMIKLNSWGEWGGYALNTTSDIVGMIIMYWFGIFRQSEDVKKRNLAFGLLASEVVTVSYSWLFSWRQLRPLMKAIEIDPIGFNNEVEWLSFIFAGFVPLMLAFIGYAQSLQVGETSKVASDNFSIEMQNIISQLQKSMVEMQNSNLQLQQEMIEMKQQNVQVQNKISYLQLPDASLRHFKDMIKNIDGQMPKYDNLSRLDKVTSICSDNGMRFSGTESTAYRWLRESGAN